MMRKASDILRAAKARISDPANWIKGAYEDGDCYCARGAVLVQCGPRDGARNNNVRQAGTLLSEVSFAKFGMCTIEYNDHPDTTHADIMAVFDEAIALAESREQ